MTKGINCEYLDTGVQPGEDFYKFVNGGWLRSTGIPADRSSWGSFHELAKATDEKVLDILQEELKEKGPSPNIAGRFFETGMDLMCIEKSKLEPLQKIFAEIDLLRDISQLPSFLGLLMRHGLASFIQFSVHPDLGNSHRYAAYLEAGSLGLPERDFYLEQDDKAKHIRSEYLNYIRELMCNEAGYSEKVAFHIGEHILSLEQELATQMMSKEDRRQIDLLYNPHTLEELSSRFSAFNWNSFFSAMAIESPGQIIVTDTQYIQFLDTYLPLLSIETLKHYLTFMVIHHVAPYVHSSLEKRHFDLFSKTLEGIEKMRPRNERLVKVVNHYLGEALGQLFVSKHFPSKAKSIALEMVGDIITAFKNRINSLDWMSKGTKAYALEKLAAFKVKIGYPDIWKDYEGLDLKDSSSYLENLLAVVEWKFQKEAKRIGKEVDREEWFMAPQVVNAYYNPMFNEIVFPAAILQPPFFDWQADAAVNYGGIGAVIGHEITHGFDDQGSRFDKEGNFNEWWTPDDRELFKNLTTQLISQFDAYYPFDDLPLNGTFTLGENIADLGGLSVAYDALQLYFKRHGYPKPIDGFTAEQRFFMSWATVWRTKIRPDALRTQIKTDPHPPGMYRAVAAPSNLDSFYDAFDIYPDSPWFRKNEDRIKIW